MPAISLDSIPRFSPAEALALLEHEYGITGTISPLPSERDQNFLIDNPNGAKLVLKIANRDDAPALLECQHAAMRRVATSGGDCKVQAVVPTRIGTDLTSIRDVRQGTRHCVRVMTWIEGAVLAKCKRRSPALHASIGAGMAHIDVALRDFAHPALHRVLQWDLRHAGLAREHVHLLTPGRRTRVERLFDAWARIDWTPLRHGVIHGDANDHNVLIENDRMSGLLDFGDMVHSAIVCDLAIAIAYTMLEETEPLSAAVRIAGAYHRINPLREAEQRVLYPLILARLAMSVCYSAQNRARIPGDEYQVVSETSALRLLEALETCSADAAIAMIGAACLPARAQVRADR